jgi:pyruvate-formate lyase-activating enzyme
MSEIKTFNGDPNFSIVMPGGCNAACPFCFNKSKGTQLRVINDFDWLLNMQNILMALPELFYQISITGNEPMISPIIEGVLTLCKRMKPKYHNILLTTNGTNLLTKINEVVAGVHHINISRHHYDEEENKRIFGGKYNVTDAELMQIIDKYSARGVDVSLNCVINDETTPDFIMGFIHFAKTIGAHAVRFRKQNGDNLDMTPAEATLDSQYPILHRGECPVCRTWLRVIRGMTTYWKAAVIEPTDKVKDSVYELVYDTDGMLYLDWNRNVPFQLTETPKPRQRKAKPFDGGCKDVNFFTPSMDCGMPRRSSSCGGTSSSSCGGPSGSHC